MWASRLPLRLRTASRVVHAFTPPQPHSHNLLVISIPCRCFSVSPLHRIEEAPPWSYFEKKPRQPKREFKPIIEPDPYEDLGLEEEPEQEPTSPSRGPQKRGTAASADGATKFLVPGLPLPPVVADHIQLHIPKPARVLGKPDRWKVVFTGAGAREAVSTTNIKVFSEDNLDFEELDTDVIAIIPSHGGKIDKWTKEIQSSFELAGSIKITIIPDPRYRILSKIGIAKPAEGYLPTLNALYILDGKDVVRYSQILPSTVGFNVMDISRTVAALQTHDDHIVYIPANWGPGRDAILPFHDRKNPKKKLPGEIPEEAELKYDEETDEVYELKEPLEKGRLRMEDMEVGEDDLGETILTSEVWQVLPYLKFVRVNDSVDNQSSVIGYEAMRVNLLKKFEKYKEEMAEKEARERMGR